MSIIEESRVEQAVYAKSNGSNCAQAVACTYADLTDLDPDTLRTVLAEFGAGMGTMKGTCGAVVGACAVASSILKKQAPGTGKPALLRKEIQKRFEERTGGYLICSDLKGITSGKPAVPCNDCVKFASEILEEVLNQQ